MNFINNENYINNVLKLVCDKLEVESCIIIVPIKELKQFRILCNAKDGQGEESLELKKLYDGMKEVAEAN